MTVFPEIPGSSLDSVSTFFPSINSELMSINYPLVIGTHCIQVGQLVSLTNVKLPNHSCTAAYSFLSICCAVMHLTFPCHRKQQDYINLLDYLLLPVY